MKSFSCLALVLLAAIASAEIRRMVIPNHRFPEKQNGKSLVNVPINMAVRLGDTVELFCETNSSALPPVSRIHWWEFVTTDFGQMISDNEVILGSHPNARRYRIIQAAPEQFHLEIRDVQMEDGGTYTCLDGQSGPPDVYQGFAELIVIRGEPNCTSIVPANGIVIEGQNYTMTCQIYYQGNMSPRMTWEGPEPFITTTVTNPTDVFSGVLFTIDRSMDTRAYRQITNFTKPLSVPADVADNAPAYEYIYQSGQLFVYWGPKNMTASPIKPHYNPGDIITCNADAFPPPFYQWQDMRTLELFSAQHFNVSESMRGFNTTMRCQAQNLIQGFLHTQNIFIQVDVPLLTTPATTTTPLPTTPAPADAPCRNISGWWISDDPYAEMHLHVASGASARVTGFMRNYTDQQWVEIVGRTRLPDYAFLGLSAIWPYEIGVTGMSGECHRCFGVETIITAGGWRSYYDSSTCGHGGSPSPYTAYNFRKLGEESASSIYSPDFKVYKPTKEVSGKFGLKY
jgi:hypothetical protein